jgi:hypothetical protein
MERWQRNTLIAIALLFAYQTYKVNTTDKVEEPSAFDVCIEENNIAFNFDTLDYLYEDVSDEQIEKAVEDFLETGEMKLRDEEDEQAYKDELKRYSDELLTKCGDVKD